MTNLKTIFKQKSKLLLIVLSLLGMIFSYSCSCRSDRITGGGGEENDGGTITTSISISDKLMVANSTGDGMKKDGITVSITGASADVDTFTISGLTDLTEKNFELKNGVLKLVSGFDKPTTTKETATLVVDYKKKLSSDTLDHDKGTNTFELVKVTVKTMKDIEEIFTEDLGDFINPVSFKFKSGGKIDGNNYQVDVEGIDDDNNVGSYETKKIGKDVFGSDKLLNRLKSSVTKRDYLKDITYVENKPNGDNQIFYYNLVFEDAYEMQNTKIGIEIKNHIKNTPAIEWTE